MCGKGCGGSAVVMTLSNPSTPVSENRQNLEPDDALFLIATNVPEAKGP